MGAQGGDGGKGGGGGGGQGRRSRRKGGGAGRCESWGLGWRMRGMSSREGRQGGVGTSTSCMALQHLAMMYTNGHIMAADFPYRVDSHHQHKLSKHQPAQLWKQYINWSWWVMQLSTCHCANAVLSQHTCSGCLAELCVIQLGIEMWLNSHLATCLLCLSAIIVHNSNTSVTHLCVMHALCRACYESNDAWWLFCSTPWLCNSSGT